MAQKRAIGTATSYLPQFGALPIWQTPIYLCVWDEASHFGKSLLTNVALGP